ncbi:MAG: EAL domain-containing protein [Campylobacterota bacterium]|nr:EAL domain-containing protein [Campylobacterota bacterium]
MKNEKSLKNHSVINSIVIAAVAMVSVLFFFIPYLTEQYTIKTIIKHSKHTAEQIKLTRAYCVDVVVDDVKKYAPNLKFNYDHWGVDGQLPLPTTTIHDLSKIFSENTGLTYNLYSDYPFTNRKDRVLTSFQKEAIKYTKENKDGIYIKRDVIDGKEVLRVATTDYMTDLSCVNCHNKHTDRTWRKNKWKLGDKRGVLEVTTPLNDELVGHRVMRNYIILLIIITFGLILFYLFQKMSKRENELLTVADKLELTVDDKNKELKNLGGLLDHYVISSKTDTKGNLTYVSQAFMSISGYSEKELLNQPHSIVRHPDMSKNTFKNLWETIQTGKTWRGEIKNIKKDGGYYWVDAVISADYDKDHNIIGYSAIRLDITSQKEAQYLASHDFLTSLPNKAKFEEIASHAIKVANRDKTSLAILFIDFDKFKNINDTLGHLVGDEMLKIVATRMQSVLRDVDTIARIGGDEFVILLESIQDIQNISNIIDKLLAIVRKPIHISNNQLHTTASIGISIYPNDGTTISQLMKNADSAMYHAKEKGRDNYQFYTENLNTILTRKLKIEDALRVAVKNNGFDFVFQPKYNLKSHQCNSCEVLIRLTDQEIGVISPTEFIPIAEENRMIVDIGYIVFEKACQVFKQWQNLNLGIEVISVNISSIQLVQEDIVEYLINRVEKNDILPKNIELELTEHSIVENLEENIKILARLRSFGFKISIDDFGTGYSSMSYLKKLPIDTIKIDKSFIDDISLNKKDCAITHAIIQLSKDLGYEVIAEGIEDNKQENILIDLDCQWGQGFVYSKGLANDDFIAFIKKGHN